MNFTKSYIFGTRNPDQNKLLWKLNDISEKTENEGTDMDLKLKSTIPILFIKCLCTLQIMCIHYIVIMKLEN